MAAMIAARSAFFAPPADETALAVTETAREKILLVPLDTRPPCRQFACDIGDIAGFAVEVPPSAALDYYSLPGEPPLVKKWLKENAKDAALIIVSVDQLLYGGLLAARAKNKTAAEVDEMIAFLRELHEAYPDTPIHAFGILPRMEPQPDIDGFYERRRLVEYSRLVGKRFAGVPVDEKKIDELEKKISPDSMRKYLAHFDENLATNKKLAALAEEGTLARLVLGQDDGEPYGIPNIEMARLKDCIAASGANDKKVFLTHGADEIALMLVADFKLQQTKTRPKVFVEYADENTAHRVMPYMAITMQETVAEKIAMLSAEQTLREDEADFILFVFAGDNENAKTDCRPNGAKFIGERIKEGRRVALVDLSRRFGADETLFPLLVAKNIPVNNLIAYAGWNTASNSVGTALAESCVFAAGARSVRNKDDAVRLYAKNIRFLQNRFFEDFFYLKDVIDSVNATIKKAGYINTADLDLAHNYRYANALMQNAMTKRLKIYRETRAFRAPVKISAPDGDFFVRAADLNADISYPWPRTFEIYLESSLTLYETKPGS